MTQHVRSRGLTLLATLGLVWAAPGPVLPHDEASGAHGESSKVDGVPLREGFEESVPELHTYQAKYAADDTLAHTGARCLRVSPTAESGGAYFRLDGLIDKSADYEFSAWVHAATTGAVRLYISASDGTKRYTKSQVTGGFSGKWVLLTGTVRKKQWQDTDTDIMLAMVTSGESRFDDVRLRKTQLPPPPAEAYPDLWRRLRAAADARISALPPVGTLVLQAENAALAPALEAPPVDMPRGPTAVVPSDGLLTFAVQVPAATYVEGVLTLGPDSDLRPGLRATVLCDNTVVAAPMVRASPWESEGNALTGPAPAILGDRPPDQVSLTKWLMPPGRHYLTIAGPHFRPGGEFRRLELVTLPTAAQRPVYRFALLSDTHLGSGSAGWMNVKLSGPAHDELAATLSALASEGIDFALIAGDMTDSATREQFAAVGTICAKAPIPVYGCIGNHDAYLASSRADALELCAPMFPSGTTDYVLDKPGLRFIILDASHWKSKHGGFLDHYDRELVAGIGPTPDEIQWLKQVLEEDKETPLVLVLHYPLAGRSGPSSCGYQVRNVNLGGQVAQLVQAAPNLVAVLCGHTHWNEAVDVDHTTHLTNPAFCEWPNAYRVFRVYGDRLEWEMRQVGNRGFIRQSFAAPKGLSWMISTGEGDLGGSIPLRPREGPAH